MYNIFNIVKNHAYKNLIILICQLFKFLIFNTFLVYIKINLHFHIDTNNWK